MAKKSEYESPQSLKSASIIDKMLKDSTLTSADIIFFQTQFGVSSLELSRLSGHAPAQISDWKSGKSKIPLRAQQHLKLLFEKFEKQFQSQETFFSEKLKDANAFLEKAGLPQE